MAFEQGVGFTGAEITDGCKLPDVVWEAELGSSVSTACALNL